MSVGRFSSTLTSTLTCLTDFLFPPLCHVCRKFISNAGPLHICLSCLAEMAPVDQPLCPVCGIPFAGAGVDHLCGKCHSKKPFFDAARAAYVYEGHCRQLIHFFKYNNKTHLRRPLALLLIQRLAEFVQSAAPDLIVPVPLHARRLRSRGFNQAVLLGEFFSKNWNLPMDRWALKRIRWTEPQINLSADERLENVKGAFAVAGNSRISGKRVMLVDDVLTTGSTVEECAKVLKKAGAAEVIVVTVARAISESR